MNSQFLGLFTRKPACAFKNLECYLADQLNIHVFYFTCLSDDLWLSLGVQVEQSAFQTTPESCPFLPVTPECAEPAMRDLSCFMFEHLGRKLGVLNFVGDEMVLGV